MVARLELDYTLDSAGVTGGWAATLRAGKMEFTAYGKTQDEAVTNLVLYVGDYLLDHEGDENG
jgi:hypothetical protein